MHFTARVLNYLCLPTLLNPFSGSVSVRAAVVEWICMDMNVCYVVKQWDPHGNTDIWVLSCKHNPIEMVGNRLDPCTDLVIHFLLRLLGKLSFDSYVGKTINVTQYLNRLLAHELNVRSFNLSQLDLVCGDEHSTLIPSSCFTYKQQ